MLLSEWSGRRGGSLRFWGPGLLSTSPAFSMSSASHSAGSSGWLAQKTGAGPTFQWAGKVDAICRSRSNRAKRPRAGCILRSSCNWSLVTSNCYMHTLLYPCNLNCVPSLFDYCLKTTAIHLFPISVCD